MDKWSKKIFLNTSFGLGVYIVHAKNGILAIFSFFSIPKNVIISDISCRSLVLIHTEWPLEENDIAIVQEDVGID